MAKTDSAMSLHYQAKNYRDKPRELFDRLINAILEEYKSQGRCIFVEELCSGRIPSVTLAEYSALREADHYLRHGKRTHPDYLAVIPHVYDHRERDGVPVYIPWDRGMTSVPPSQYQEEARQFDNLARNHFRRDRHNAVQPGAPGGRRIPIGDSTEALEKTPEPPAPSPAQPAAPVSKEIQEARALANKILAEARQKAEKIKQDAEDEAYRIQAEAQTARSQAEELRLANQRRQQELEAAKAALAQQQTELERTAQQRADQLTDRYLWTSHLEMQKEWDEQQAKKNQEDQTAAELARMKDELCRETTALKAEWRKALEETAEKLTELQNGLDSRLRQWQSGLYPRELRPLAECCAQFYRIVNNDQALAGQVARMAQEPASSAASEELVKYLQQRHKSLKVFQGNLEKAANKLGLFLSYPEEGSPFDDALQTPANEGIEDPYGMVVARCETPGVIRRTSGELEEGEPVLPAIVTLKSRGPKWEEAARYGDV